MKKIISPVTGRKIRVGGPAFRRLYHNQVGGLYEIKHSPESGTLGRFCQWNKDYTKEKCSEWAPATDQQEYDVYGDPVGTLDSQFGGHVRAHARTRARTRTPRSGRSLKN
jgi:hypothetical protein